MGKTTQRNDKVKRKLLDELNQSDLRQNIEASKRRRLLAEDQNNSRSNSTRNSAAEHSQIATQGKISTTIQTDNDLIVKLISKNGEKTPKEREVIQRASKVQRGQHSNRYQVKPSAVKVKSKVVVPSKPNVVVNQTKQTRSRVVKPPARYLDNETTNSKKVVKRQTRERRPKLSKTDIILGLADIDKQSNSEIADGNIAAGPEGRAIDHDGVELSINGSDIDDFSDEETLAGGGEPGEIISSGEEDQAPTHDPLIATASGIEQLSANRATTSHQVASTTTGKIDRLKKFSHLRHDPDFNSFLDEVLDKKLSGKMSNGSKTKGMVAKNINSNHTRKEQNNQVRTVKSPSDTTLYTPGLSRVNEQRGINAIEKISNFVESMRIDNSATAGSAMRNKRDTTPARRHNIPKSHTSRKDDAIPSSSRRLIHDAHQNEDSDNEGEEAERTADQLLIQAEKFKARVEAPKGTVNNFNIVNSRNSMLMPYDYDRLRSRFVTEEGLAPLDSEILFLRNFDQDDEFFHVTSQIDPNLKLKIERGEFVDLDRLLPKDKFSSGTRGDDLNKQLFQLISQGTNSYLTTPEARGNNRVNSIKKWDQAFRVFAAIYTQANPSRASEIWQYVYVIHTAATCNPWDNVAFYDITFRELMANKPWRNWGKTYTQGWNMAFNNGNNYHHGSLNMGNQNHNNQARSNNNNNNQHSWKDDCCWLFNKNKCRKTANECKYDHRCTYCAGWYHSKFNCRKKNNRGSNGYGGSKPNNGNGSNGNSYGHSSSYNNPPKSSTPAKGGDSKK